MSLPHRRISRAPHDAILAPLMSIGHHRGPNCKTWLLATTSTVARARNVCRSIGAHFRATEMLRKCEIKTLSQHVVVFAMIVLDFSCVV
jgi:hypothetical protein